MSRARPRSRGRVDRTRARAWALQVLYAWEARGSQEGLVEALDATLAVRRISSRREPYLRLLLETLDRELPSVDAALESCLENWTVERLSRLDRSILRLAAAEILFIDEVPAPVSIQEAIRLAESYSGEESARFVNGVLDALYRRDRSGS